MKLPLTFELIRKCWDVAEQRTCNLISTKYHAHDEVFITRILYGEVSEEFSKMNDSETFEKAFSEDLASMYNNPRLTEEISRLSKGVIAKIAYHEPQEEKFSGADFGLAFVKPVFEQTMQNQLKYRMRQQGLLCQAKREKENGKFGQLTPNQIEVIPKHLRYFSILLYRYLDKSRRNLLPFAWWTDDFWDVDDIVYFLDNVDIEETVGSGDLLRKLAEERLGTDDNDLIRRFISPEEIPYVVVEITWRDGFPPRPPTGPNSGLSQKLKDLSKKSKQQKPNTQRLRHPQVKHTKTRTM